MKSENHLKTGGVIIVQNKKLLNKICSQSKF